MLPAHPGRGQGLCPDGRKEAPGASPLQAASPQAARTLGAASSPSHTHFQGVAPAAACQMEASCQAGTEPRPGSWAWTGLCV